MSEKMTVSEFSAATAKGVTLVDFWATWCGPCRMLMPVIEQIKTEMAGKVQVLKLDVDDNQELAKQFNVRTIPALFILKDGEVVEQFTGVQDKNRLLNALKNA